LQAKCVAAEIRGQLLVRPDIAQGIQLERLGNVSARRPTPARLDHSIPATITVAADVRHGTIRSAGSHRPRFDTARKTAATAVLRLVEPLNCRSAAGLQIVVRSLGRATALAASHLGNPQGDDQTKGNEP